MTYKQFIPIVLTVFLFASAAAAQRPEVTISLNEAFFDSLLDAVYQNSPPLEFSMAANGESTRPTAPAPALGFAAAPPPCKEVFNCV